MTATTATSTPDTTPDLASRTTAFRQHLDQLVGRRESPTSIELVRELDELHRAAMVEAVQLTRGGERATLRADRSRAAAAVDACTCAVCTTQDHTAWHRALALLLVEARSLTDVFVRRMPWSQREEAAVAEHIERASAALRFGVSAWWTVWHALAALAVIRAQIQVRWLCVAGSGARQAPARWQIRNTAPRRARSRAGAGALERVFDLLVDPEADVDELDRALDEVDGRALERALGIDFSDADAALNGSA